MQNYGSSKKNNRNLISNLQNLNKEEKKIIINITFLQSAISKMKRHSSFDEKVMVLYYFIEF